MQLVIELTDHITDVVIKSLTQTSLGSQVQLETMFEKHRIKRNRQTVS